MAHAAESGRREPHPRGTRPADAARPDPGEAALRIAFEASPIGILIGAGAGRAARANESMGRLLGRPRAGLNVETLLDASHPDDRPRLHAALCAVTRGDDDVDRYEHRFVRPDGTVAWARVSLSADHAGHPGRGDRALLVQAEDLSELRGLERALRANSARTDALLRHAGEVVMVIGRAGAIQYASPAVEEVLGYDPESFAFLHLFDVLHPDDREAWLEGWRRVTAGSGARFAVSTRVLHADGQYRWCEATLRDLTGESEIDGYLAHFHDVTERRRSEDDLAARALHDALTGLANRVLLVDRMRHALDRAQRRGTVVALLFCDLDRFKRINDFFGHAVGDAVLREVAARLRAVVRPSDTVARLGGDEFVVCCEDVEGGTEAETLAERILVALRAPFAIDGQELALSTSVGIATAGRATDSPDDMLRDADAAMYTAKSLGRDRSERFDERIGARRRDRIETGHGLRRALTDGELRLHYQATFSIDDRSIEGVEALVRWVHPGRGMLGPSDFLPAARECGAGSRLLQWVVGEASRQVRAWSRRGGTVPPVWINLSLDQLTQPGVRGVVASTLTEHDVPAGALGFEVAEPTLAELEQSSGANDALLGLAELGCRLAIDDFGTASTSLRSVHRYGIELVKVDRSVWSELEPAPLLGSAVSFGALLGLRVSAKGVETADQLDLLRSAGCRYASGYLLARPSPAAGLDAALGV